MVVIVVVVVAVAVVAVAVVVIAVIFRATDFVGIDIIGVINISINHQDQRLTGVDANEPFGGSQPLLTIKRLSNAAMNAAIFWATKNPPDLLAGYVIDFMV